MITGWARQEISTLCTGLKSEHFPESYNSIIEIGVYAPQVRGVQRTKCLLSKTYLKSYCRVVNLTGPLKNAKCLFFQFFQKNGAYT